MISDLAGMRNYLRIQLGSGTPGNGVINVELSVEQLNQCIEKSIDTFIRYNAGEAIYEDFLVLNLQSGVSAYSLAGADVTDVIDFSMSSLNQSNNINHLFSPLNLMYGNNFPTLFTGQNQDMALSNYQVAMNYLEMIDDVFSIKFRMDYREAQQKLVFTPTPPDSGTVLIKVFRKETAANLYNNLLVKELAEALAKKIWGRILSKYGPVQLPGGGSYEAFGIKLWDEGKEEEKEIKEKMKNEGESYMGFIIG